MPRALKVSTGTLNNGLLAVPSQNLNVPGTVTAGALGTFYIATTTWDPGNLANGASEKKSSIALTGARVGTPVFAALTTIISSDWAVQACCTASDVAEVKITNNTGGDVDLASGTLTVWTVK